MESYSFRRRFGPLFTSPELMVRPCTQATSTPFIAERLAFSQQLLTRRLPHAELKNTQETISPNHDHRPFISASSGYLHASFKISAERKGKRTDLPTS